MRSLLTGIAAACAISAPAIAQDQALAAAIEGTRLDIVATGESHRVPDIATIGAGVVTEAVTAGEALSANSARMRTVLAALRRAGIAERDIQTASINLSPRYDYSDRSEPRLVGYTASNQLSVRFRELERAGAIVDALVAEGVNQINGPSLGIAEPDAALDEARRDALRAARERAALYASSLGMEVGRIVAISEAGAARPPMPYAMRTSLDAQESVPIAPGEQTLSVTLSVTFELR